MKGKLLSDPPSRRSPLGVSRNSVHLLAMRGCIRSRPRQIDVGLGLALCLVRPLRAKATMSRSPRAWPPAARRRCSAVSEDLKFPAAAGKLGALFRAMDCVHWNANSKNGWSQKSPCLSDVHQGSNEKSDVVPLQDIKVVERAL